MAGYLGADFDPNQPENSDSVKFGAEWIRDLKRRVKLFGSTLFNLETGTLRDSVVRHASLTDMAGLVAGTYNRVKVNSKGLVYEGATTSEQQTANLYAATFLPTGKYTIERKDAVALTGSGVSVDSIFRGVLDYDGTGGSVTPPYDTSYSVQGKYAEFVWSPPAGVRRVKATIIGGGGGAFSNTSANPSNWYGGAGGEFAEAIFNVDGSGVQSLTIIAGSGGQPASTSINTSFGDGLPSRVRLSSGVYVDAAGGTKGTTTAGGFVSVGAAAGGLLIVRSPGTAGGLNLGGQSGSNYNGYGRGGVPGGNPLAMDGVVILEWLQ